MRILAVDDERLALDALVSAIREAEPLAQVFGFRKAGEALEFYKSNSCEVAFLDIQMRNMSGVELAQNLKIINPNINIIFATGFNEYMGTALDMHVSGYLTKPITAGKVRKELDNLRHPVISSAGKRVKFVTFGNFEAYVDGKPLLFKYDRTKEMLAYLVDRDGAYCTNSEIMAALWEDERRASYLSNLKKDLIDTLHEKGCDDVIDSGWGKLRVDKNKVDCDYYDWCMGKIEAINSYRGEYMSQYSWAEFTNAVLERRR